MNRKLSEVAAELEAVCAELEVARLNVRQTNHLFCELRNSELAVERRRDALLAEIHAISGVAR